MRVQLALAVVAVLGCKDDGKGSSKAAKTPEQRAASAASALEARCEDGSLEHCRSLGVMYSEGQG
ncbi:MAG: hypothetical protein KJO07_03250, partial [Deltaproteobacteria bacterium]|nr:hypothetical protein [Deltaproteobacteria bacterium]